MFVKRFKSEKKARKYLSKAYVYAAGRKLIVAMVGGHVGNEIVIAQYDSATKTCEWSRKAELFIEVKGKYFDICCDIIYYADL